MSAGDRVRQVAVTVAEVCCVVGTLVGVGVLGTAVSDTAGGALSADATLLAPAGTAFSIWSLVYLGLAAFTVWQWLPAQAADPRTRSLGWLVAASMLLNAGWLLVTQQGWVWGGFAVIVALLLVLARLVRLTGARPARSTVERVVVDLTLGLYLGWVALATCANLAAALTDSGAVVGRPLAVVVLAVAVAALVLALARLRPSRWAAGAVVAGAGWGLLWIGNGRVGAEPTSYVVAVAAYAGLALLVVGGLRTGPRLRR